MKKHTAPLCSESFYHIYNRGINGEDLFKEEKNYAFFLERFAKYIQPVAETYAYCLLKNHFHFLIRTRNTLEIIQNAGNKTNVGRVWNPADVDLDAEKIASNLISRRFSALFNSYAQAINKRYGRTGGLFEEPFRRIPVNQNEYCLALVFYIHANPQKHRFVYDFRNYQHSSYSTFLSFASTKLQRKEVLDWFEGKEGFLEYHLNTEIPIELKDYEIELD